MKVVAAQIIFLVIAIIGFIFIKASEIGSALFTAGLILLIAAIIVQVALLMIPVVKAIVEKFKDKKEDEESDDNAGMQL